MTSKRRYCRRRFALTSNYDKQKNQQLLRMKFINHQQENMKTLIMIPLLHPKMILKVQRLSKQMLLPLMIYPLLKMAKMKGILSASFQRLSIREALVNASEGFKAELLSYCQCSISCESYSQPPVTIRHQ